MKKLSYALFAILPALMLPSCLENKYETTPQIGIDNRILINGVDTILIGYNATEKKYTTDTIQVGDTATLMVLFDAVGNNLTAGRIDYKSELAKLEVPLTENLLSVIDTTHTDGSFSFTIQNGFRAVSLQLNYIPIKAGVGQFDFRVESDSEFSPNSLSLLTPIAE